MNASRKPKAATMALWFIFLPGAIATLVPQLLKRARLEPTGGDCGFGCKGGLCIGGIAGYCTERCKKSSDCPEKYFCNKEKACQREPWMRFGQPRCAGLPDICLGTCLSTSSDSYCSDRCERADDCPSGFECAALGDPLGSMRESQEKYCVSSLRSIREATFPLPPPRKTVGASAFYGCNSGRQIGRGVWGYCTEPCARSSDCPPQYRCNRDHLCEKRLEKGAIEFGGMCNGRATVCLSGICANLVLPDREAPALKLYPLDWCTDPCDEERKCQKGWECRSFEGLSTKVCSPIRRPEIEKTLKYFVTTREKEEREAAEDLP
jgi:hypothetical protein